MKDSASPSFAAVVSSHGADLVRSGALTTLQINVGKLCNQACHHCHVEAGPGRTEIMSQPVIDRLLQLLERSPSVNTVDITGGAPEMNPGFRGLVLGARRLGKAVMVRSNLTILMEPDFQGTMEFLAEQCVHLVASLPCYTKDNVDRQRGTETFDASIQALRRLNAIGYGRPGSNLKLDLAYNPLGPTLPGDQSKLERDYKRRLWDDLGIEFHELFVITNMPISRFADALRRAGSLDRYQDLLEASFNPVAASKIMCRNLISVSHDGRFYDCDFNQMLEMPTAKGGEVTVFDVDSLGRWEGEEIRTGQHCFGCTAGAGSSCGGALV